MIRALLFTCLVLTVLAMLLTGQKGTITDKEYFPSTPNFPKACYQFTLDTWRGQEVKCVSQHDYDNFYVGDKY